MILGSGARIYPESRDTIPLKLDFQQTFPTGVVVHHYQPGDTDLSAT